MNQNNFQKDLNMLIDQEIEELDLKAGWSKGTNKANNTTITTAPQMVTR